MKKVFKLKQTFYNKMVGDTEFEKDLDRPYFIIRGLSYKGSKVTVGIPLRSNINKEFAKKTDEYISTPPSDHTLTGKGNIAGWHIVKMIPIDFSVVVGQSIVAGSSLEIPFEIANTFSNTQLIEKVKKMLARFENGEQVFGAVDFDGAIRKLNESKSKK